VTANTLDEVKAFSPTEKDGDEAGGEPLKFVYAHYDGSREVEDMVQKEYKATIRCLPFDGSKEPGTCVFTGKPSARRVVFARAY
jgi:prolyl-tRNA synthetase